MRFQPTELYGVILVTPEAHEDERGVFARTFCQREFEQHNLPSSFVQCSTSYNRNRATLRGMHFQAPPAEEGKLVRCTRGAIYDVVLDLRAKSPMFLRWQAFVLTAENRQQLYIPEGVAHGFQTLEDHSEVYYQMTQFYAPELSRGVRWNDPAFGIAWALPEPIMSERDAGYPDYSK
jgi:dTDP-4-dehydrorhamnose 3,5-epimerase